MTNTTSPAGVVIDPQTNPYMGYEHVVQRTAFIAENNAALSSILNRMLSVGALMCAAHGLLTDNKVSAAACTTLVVAHTANARFSRRQQQRYEVTKDIVTYAIAARPVHENAENMEKPNKLELTSHEYRMIGGLRASSLKERSTKFTTLALDFAALSGLAYLSDHPATTVGMGALSLWSARTAYKLWSESRTPAETLGAGEVRDFMKVGQQLLVYRAPAPKPLAST